MRSVFIEKPVEYISVSTTSRAPSAAARSIIGARRAKFSSGCSHTMSCWMPATIIFARLFKPRARLVEHLGALAAREPHERRAGRDVVVEHDARDRDHTAPMRQRPAEREPVGLAERADVDRHEVRALRPEHVEAGVGQTRAEPVALVEHLGAELGRSTRRAVASPTAIAYWNGPLLT